MEFKIEITAKGHLKRRESFDLEFKANFHLGNQLLEYCRSLVGMANNKGGQIVFGIKDKPRQPEGMTNDKFTSCDPAKINQTLMEYFSHELEWEMDTFEYDGKTFGKLTIKEANQKPVVCKKNGDKILREGAIYYRYRAETKEIHYAELSQLLQHERDKEKLLWMKHIEKIGSVGPQNIHLLDTYNGELITHDGKIVMDKALLKSIKFIKEGHFVEKDGAPAIKLVGEITGLAEMQAMTNPEFVYPYRAEEVQEKCKINQFEFQLLVNHFKIKETPKFHTSIKSGKSTSLHKYTQECVDFLNRELKKNSSLITQLRQKHKQTGRKRTKK